MRHMSQPDAISAMDAGIQLFYIVDCVEEIYIRIGETGSGKRYLKSFRDDGEQPDDLLRLPDCPISAAEPSFGLRRLQ
jgi:hypothetical protein